MSTTAADEPPVSRLVPYGTVDLIWEEPALGRRVRGLADICRIILHDRHGTGLSSRNVPPPNLETRVSDLLLGPDTVGSGRPVLAGMDERGAANARCAATKPERVRSMVWVNFAFEDRGECELKGVPGNWRLLRSLITCPSPPVSTRSRDPRGGAARPGGLESVAIV